MGLRIYNDNYASCSLLACLAWLCITLQLSLVTVLLSWLEKCFLCVCVCVCVCVCEVPQWTRWTTSGVWSGSTTSVSSSCWPGVENSSRYKLIASNAARLVNELVTVSDIMAILCIEWRLVRAWCGLDMCRWSVRNTGQRPVRWHLATSRLYHCLKNTNLIASPENFSYRRYQWTHDSRTNTNNNNNN